MSAWTLIQIVFDIFIATGGFVILMRLNRAPKDDPRLSRGLQLLQSKISVMEDLSDRTETQVGQLTAILEQKSREVQAKVQLAEQHVHEIRVSMERSLEVAKIFQDKIPHKEIIERQNTIKYVQAARLAHQGLSTEEIASQVDLSKGEIEFIASVNRERLMFDEGQLPDWARETPNQNQSQNQSQNQTQVPAQHSANSHQPSRTQDAHAQAQFQSGFQPVLQSLSFVDQNPARVEVPETQEEAAQRLRAELELAENQRLVENLSRLQFEMKNLDLELARENSHRDLSAAFEIPKVETATLKKLGEEFRKAVEEGQVNDARQPLASLDQLSQYIPHVLNAAESLAPATNESTRFAAEPVPTVVPSATAAPFPASPLDPAAARELAQQKLKAALRATAPAPKSQVSPELSAARALAKEGAAPVTRHLINGRSTTVAPVVKRIQFPRIDETET